MKKSLPGMLAFGFILQAGLAVAQQNLVTNPGFETGDTTGWFGFGSPTLSAETNEVHSGTYAAEVSNRTQTYDGIAQSFLGVLQPGQVYNVTAWLRIAGGAGQSMQLTMQKTDGSGTSYSAIASGSVSSSGWTELSGQYTYNPTGTVSTLTFYAEVPGSSNAAYYIDDVSVVSTTLTPANGACAVDWTGVDQRIDGFGASSAWRSSWTSTEADMFFGTNNGVGTSFDGKTNFSFAGIGLSLLRNHITYASSTSASAVPTTAETNIMQMAQARGALVWSTPWTPAAGFKSAADIYDSGRAASGGIDGGSFLGGDATNQAYASQLANYVVSMENLGINIYAISVQNEPDADVTTYEACQWTGTQIHDFTTNLYNALAAKGVASTKIIMPESQNWTDPHDLMGPALSDPNVAADVSIVADHDYGDTGTPAQKSVSGQSEWETEIATFDAYDGSMSNAVYWAYRIHLFMTAAQANAWHYWWLYPSGTDNEGLTDNNGIPAKRMYALGQFARFVRPGYYRIDVDSNSGSAFISAYKNPGSGDFAVVAINSSSVVVTQTFSFANITGISSVTPWVTSSGLSLFNQAPVPVSNASFSYALPALSIVTFVGTAGSTNPPAAPTGLAAVPGNAQVSLSWTASAGAAGYNIYRSTSSGGPYSQLVSGVAATSYTDATAVNGTTYYYVVSAVNGYGESGYSNEAIATPCAVPTAPTGLTATGGQAQIVVSWTAVPEGISYNISRSTGSGGPYSQIAGGVTTTNYTDSGLADGTTYFYYVTAVNDCGPGAPSAFIGAITIPATPTGLAAVAGNAQVALNWTGSFGATSYNVKRSTVSGGPYTTLAAPGSASYTDTTAANGATYYYVVSAVNGSGESGNSSEVSATPTAATPPAAPTNLTASAGKRSATLRWTQSTGSNISGNKVYRSTANGGPYTLVASVAATTSYTDTGLTSRRTYYYVVTAVNSSSLESPYSNQASATAR